MSNLPISHSQLWYQTVSRFYQCFSYSTTARQGPAAMQPWESNGVIELGQTNPVVVRPGDAIIGDQDGVVVVPAAAAEKVYEIALVIRVIDAFQDAGEEIGNQTFYLLLGSPWQFSF